MKIKPINEVLREINNTIQRQRYVKKTTKIIMKQVRKTEKQKQL